MRRNRTMLWTLLAITIFCMTMGYAALSQRLDINGTASIDSRWQVEIINLQEGERTGQVATRSKSYSATTANFDVDLTNPGDKISYIITIKNKGTLDAQLDSILITRTDNPAIIFDISNIAEGEVLAAGAEKQVYASVEYSNMVTKQPDATNGAYGVTLNYIQDTGRTPTVVTNTSNFAFDNTSLTGYTTFAEEVELENGNLNIYGPWESYGDTAIVKVTLPAQYNSLLNNSTLTSTVVGPGINKTEVYNLKDMVATSEFEEEQYMYLFIKYYNATTTETLTFNMNGTDYSFNVKLLQPRS